MLKVKIKSIREAKSLKEWFSEKDFRKMSPEEQQEYLAQHPNSKFQPDNNDGNKDNKDDKSKEVPSKDKEQPNDKDTQKIEKFKQKLKDKIKDKYPGDLNTTHRNVVYYDTIENEILKNIRLNNSIINNPLKHKEGTKPRYSIYAKLINELSPGRRYDLLQRDGNLIQFVNDPTEEEISLIASYHPMSLAYVDPDKVTEEDRENALSKDGRSIRYLKDPTEEEKIKAVENDGLAIEGIDNPSERLQSKAIENNWRAITKIKNPSDDMKKWAIKNSNNYPGLALQYIKDPTDEMKELAISISPSNLFEIDNPSEKLQLKAINNLDKYDLNQFFRKLISLYDKGPDEEYEIPNTVQQAVVNLYDPKYYGSDIFYDLEQYKIDHLPDRFKKLYKDKNIK